jgi:hypothetical protein
VAIDLAVVAAITTTDSVADSAAGTVAVATDSVACY